MPKSRLKWRHVDLICGHVTMWVDCVLGCVYGGSEVDSQYSSSHLGSASRMNRSEIFSRTGSLDSRGTFNNERRISIHSKELSSPSATADLGFTSPTSSNDLKSPASSLRGRMSRLSSFENTDLSPMQSPMASSGTGRKRFLPLLAHAAAGVVSLKERESLKRPHSHEGGVDGNDYQNKLSAENTTAGLEEESEKELKQQDASSWAKGGDGPSGQPLGDQSQDVKMSLPGKDVEELDDDNEEGEKKEEDGFTIDPPLPIVRHQQSGIGVSISQSNGNTSRESLETIETFAISLDDSTRASANISLSTTSSGNGVPSSSTNAEEISR